MGIIPMLDAYIEHQKEIITKRSEYDIRKARARQHILEGLIKALSILDEVIKLIRGSKDKRDAKLNLKQNMISAKNKQKQLYLYNFIV